MALPPYVADGLTRAENAKHDPARRLHDVVRATYQALQTVGLLLLADYLDASECSEDVDSAVHALTMPHWAQWVALNDGLVRFWQAQANDDGAEPRASRFPSLVARWPRFARRRATPCAGADWTAVCVGLPGLQHSVACGPLDGLWLARNDHAHYRAAPSCELADRLTGLARHGLDALFDGFEVDWLARDSEGATRPLFKAPGSEPVVRIEVHGGQGPVDVSPLIVAPPRDLEVSAAAPDDWRESAMLLDGWSRSRGAGLLGARTAGTSRSVLEQWTQCLSGLSTGGGFRRGKARSPAQRLSTLQATVKDVLRRSDSDRIAAIDPCEVPAAATLRDALSSPGSPIRVIGAAGSGKSTLVAGLVENPSPGPDRAAPLAVVVPAGDLASGGMDAVLRWLERASGSRPGAWSTAAALLNWMDVHLPAAVGGRMWLVIDAVDEAPQPRALLADLDALAREVVARPWLGLLVTLRSGIPLPASGDAPWRSFPRPTGGMAPFLELSPWSEAAVRRAFEAAVDVPFDDLPESWRAEMTGPLWLALAVKALRQRGRSALVEALPLVDEYLGATVGHDTEAGAALAEIGAWLYDHRATAIPLARAEQWADRWRRHAEGAGPRLRMDPIEMLVSAGVLLPPASARFAVEVSALSFRFTHRVLLLHVVTQELGRRAGAQPAKASSDFWTECLHHAAGGADDEPYGPLVEALQVPLALACQNGRWDVAEAALALGSEAARADLLRPMLVLGARGLLPIEDCLESLSEASKLAPRLGHLLAGLLDVLLELGLDAGAVRYCVFVLRALKDPVEGLGEEERAIDVIAALKIRGHVLQTAMAFDSARSDFAAALGIARIRLQSVPDDPQTLELVAGALSRLGRLELAAGCPGDAVAPFEEALRLRTLVAKAGGLHARLCLARAHGDLAQRWGASHPGLRRGARLLWPPLRGGHRGRRYAEPPAVIVRETKDCDVLHPKPPTPGEAIGGSKGGRARRIPGGSGGRESPLL